MCLALVEHTNKQTKEEEEEEEEEEEQKKQNPSKDQRPKP